MPLLKDNLPQMFTPHSLNIHKINELQTGIYLAKELIRRKVELNWWVAESSIIIS
jgi:hypothetical protein